MELIHLKKIVLEDITLQVKKGEKVAILGKNGSGKTTLLKIISGVLKQNSGSIEIEENKSQIDEICIINANDRSFFWRLTVRENLYFFYTLSKDKFENKLKEVCRLLRIEHLLKSRYMTLSSGEKKKIQLARSLMREPKILIMDEALSSLDINTKNIFLSELDNLLNLGLLDAILFTSHSDEEIINFADRFVFLKNGKISKSLKNPRSLTANDFVKLLVEIGRAHV